MSLVNINLNCLWSKQVFVMEREFIIIFQYQHIALRCGHFVTKKNFFRCTFCLVCHFSVLYQHIVTF